MSKSHPGRPRWRLWRFGSAFRFGTRIFLRTQHTANSAATRRFQVAKRIAPVCIALHHAHSKLAVCSAAPIWPTLRHWSRYTQKENLNGNCNQR
jgi:hypothetical protein